jgi:hypothetical protein
MESWREREKKKEEKKGKPKMKRDSRGRAQKRIAEFEIIVGFGKWTLENHAMRALVRKILHIGIQTIRPLEKHYAKCIMLEKEYDLTKRRRKGRKDRQINPASPVL